MHDIASINVKFHFSLGFPVTKSVYILFVVLDNHLKHIGHVVRMPVSECRGRQFEPLAASVRCVPEQDTFSTLLQSTQLWNEYQLAHPRERCSVI